MCEKMRNLSIMPIPNEPALYIKDKKMLIITDLHIGIETELKQYGINAISQTDNLTNKLISLCKNNNPREILLLGDIKHNIPSISYQERKDVKEFLNKIKEFGELHIIPGNHDGNIKKILTNDIIIHSSNGYQVDNISFVHGHKWPSDKVMECKQLIFGHTHPTIMLTDRLGYKSFENCWIKGRFFRNKIKQKSKEIILQAEKISKRNQVPFSGMIKINSFRIQYFEYKFKYL